MDVLNDVGMDAILYIQKALPPSSYSCLASALRWADPSYSFFLIYPLLTVLHRPKGVSLLWSLILCEIAITISQLVDSERPYWWIHESKTFKYRDLRDVDVLQYPLTCQTDGATFSRVTAINSAVCFILSRYLISVISSKLGSKTFRNYRQWFLCLVWFSYVTWLGLISLSQLFMNIHFPHQCLFGALIGIAASKWTDSKRGQIGNSPKRPVFLFTSALLLTSAAALGFRSNPASAIKKAIRWCVDKNYIQIDPAPFFSVSRFTGLSLGLGLAEISSFYSKSASFRFNWKMNLSLLILELSTGVTILYIDRILPELPLWAYYMSSFINYALLAFLVTAFMPRFVTMVTGAKPVKQKLKKL